jgi:hypothetical protein
VGKEQVLQTYLITHQCQPDIENRPKQVNNAGPPERPRKTWEAENISKQQNHIEDPSYGHTAYIQEIALNVERGEDLQVGKAKQE